jgi:hypothetical protein
VERIVGVSGDQAQRTALSEGIDWQAKPVSREQRRTPYWRKG